MKLIIDIPETFYKSIKDGMWCGNNIMSNAIETGIPISNGTWLKDSYARKCSVCGYSTCWTDEEGKTIPDNFCPNCGVRMNIE